ncbi:MAG: DUF3343 domain-containing protein [Clostridia bacterium]|nr:DUF3343 domain-containing protein [Clostridia bacterium]
MRKIIIVVGSITYAIKLRKLLTRVGIDASLIKVDNPNGGIGCIHGVEIPINDYYTAVVIMRDNNIDYSVYNSKG